MHQLDTPINFVQLLEECSQIRIPMIQRDYAQGRESQRQIRDEFLNVLYVALTAENGRDSSSVNLDFVYGSESDDGAAYFLPLDGQQRLTTLFLLHWYLAWKDNCAELFQSHFVDSDTLNSRFAYQTRRSSTDFFDKLARFTPEIPVAEKVSIKKIIIDQPWYFRSWRFDTTVQSSLNMLEAIHNKFWSVTNELFFRLVDATAPRITFQLLKLGEFNLNDDLYIKMNARGIPLTPFETFKALYSQRLKTIFANDFRALDGHTVAVVDYFASRMDTRWADFFWQHRDHETNLYDKAAINFFRAVAIVTRDPVESEYYKNNLRQFRDRGISSSYSNFLQCNWLDRELAEGIFLLLDIWSTDNQNNFARQLPDARYFDESRIFESIVRNPEGLSLAQIVQFTGYFMYLRKHKDNIDCYEFQQWMRVVFNLSVNDVYDRPDDARRSAFGLKHIVSKIGHESGDILKYFANPDNELTGFREQQIREERVKAALIIRNDGWTQLIYDAERHGYFRGQINFLLDFCGIPGEVDELEKTLRDETSNRELQKKFKRYFELARTMFNNNGLENVGEFRWERALLTIGDYLLRRGLNHSFLVDERGDPSSWKRLLRDDTEQRSIMCRLWDRLDESNNIPDQLDEIINNSPIRESWRSEFVNSPKMIEYCYKRSIRKNENNDVIHLLRSTQMNGRNVELFTYSLYKRLESNKFAEDLPNWKMTYDEVYGANAKSGISLAWRFNGQNLYFQIEYEGKSFVIYPDQKYEFGETIELSKRLQEVSPDAFEIFKKEANYSEMNDRLQVLVSYSEVKQYLKKFMHRLDSYCLQNNHRYSE